MTMLLADLGYERNPDSIRGFVVLAWLVGLFAAVSTAFLVRTLRKRGGRPSASGVEMRGAPFMRHTSGVVARLLLGIGIVAGAVYATGSLMRPGDKHYLRIAPPSEATRLALGADGRLHVGARSGYFQIDRRDKTVVASGIGSHDVRMAMGLAADGEAVYVGCQSGLFRVAADGEATPVARPGETGPAPAFSLLHASDGALWVGGISRLLRRSWEGDWQTLDNASGLTLDRVTLLYEDAQGRIWAGSDSPKTGGLVRWNAERSAFEDVSSGLPHRAVCDLATDANGLLWVATGFAGSGGAAQWNESAAVWQQEIELPILRKSKIRSLFLDSQGGFWVCSEYDGVLVRVGGEWFPRTYRKGFPCREVKDVVEADGGYWLATERGVLFLDQHPLGNAFPNSSSPESR